MAHYSAVRLLAVFLGCVVGFVFSQGDVTIPCVSSSSFTDPKTDLRCGEVVRSRTGVLYHKAYANEQLEANERCVWTLALPVDWPNEWVEIELHVLFLGYPMGDADISNSQLILTGIAPNDTTLENSLSVNGSGIYRLPFRTRLATLTFTTGDFDPSVANYNGFIVEYVAVDGDSSVSGSHQINNTLPLKLSLSASSSYRTDVSTLMIPPSRNFYSSQAATYPLVYLDLGNNPSTGAMANFTVYNFNSAALGNPWTIADEFYKANDTRLIQGHDDIQMIVMRADLGSSSNSFSFTLFQMKCIEE